MIGDNKNGGSLRLEFSIVVGLFYVTRIIVNAQMGGGLVADWVMERSARCLFLLCGPKRDPMDCRAGSSPTTSTMTYSNLLSWLRLTEFVFFLVCAYVVVLSCVPCPFMSWGPWRSCDPRRPKKKHRFCFVEYSNAEDAGKAIRALHGRKLYGRPLRVRFMTVEGHGRMDYSTSDKSKSGASTGRYE